MNQAFRMNDGQKRHLLESLNKGVRFDGRKHDRYRKITIEYGISKSAEGSARVKIGDTEVLAGVKLEITKPYPDTPDKGSLMVGTELLPLSSPEFESGPPNIKSIELARIVDRGIRESEAIDTKKLCIEEGEKAWAVIIDICPLNDAGNLMDACSIAAIAALKDTMFPEYNGTTIDYRKKTDKSLPILKTPIGVTVLKIGNNFIVDPTLAEEQATEARLTIATTEEGTICAMQKGEESPLSIEDIEKMIDIATIKSKELAKYLK